MEQFTARIYIIGVNPYVLLPAKTLKAIFKQARKDKGPIPVHGTMNGAAYKQTLVKYAGKWRLYLNMPMRKAAGADTGDTVIVTVEFDPQVRETEFHPRLKKALKENPEAKKVFDSLPPSRQKEIKRYINNLKTEATIEKNVQKAIDFLLGKPEVRFIGRDKP